ncbi:hypothetical protein GCM10011375_25590 [Hymenobacter qilianensis]|uniref:Uncharacterized protein n=2 Tax=Hymenobacter qilianensis TaxID=1385715 RepID=A0ACB5PT79_9BACT|nr:hypothetical protein [Hymenobacter qilianensis]QNP52635.1 hypothetical protein H9L05_02410 [Hymenobacter qilianensis]GGF69415.1 hypothetical protein GCM10011375_25590 [Hymenobacter qilianensis]
MNTIKHKLASVAFLVSLCLTGSSVLAQNAVRTAVQQGHGAFVSKTDKEYAIGNASLGIPTLAPDAVVMLKQVKFVITPSGNSTSVLTGMLPANQRPAQRIVFNSTHTETVDGPTKGRVYDTVAVTETDGSITYTGTLKGKGKGKK